MAQIYGISKAWGTIKTGLENIHLTASHPREVEAILESSRADYEVQILAASQNIEKNLASLEQDYDTEKIRIDSLLADLREKSSAEIDQAETVIGLYKNSPGLFNYIRNYSRVRRESKKLARLRQEFEQISKSLTQGLEKQKLALEARKDNKVALAKEECADINSQIEALKAISSSQDFARASAEFELNENLQYLPDNVQVFNNLILSSEKGPSSDKKKPSHIHIDILVLKPAGIFLITIKNPNKPPVENSPVNNEDELLTESIRFCNQLLRPDFPALIIRGILAYKGHQPALITSSAVKALPLAEVSSYINWFADEMLSSEEIESLNVRFKGMMAQEKGFIQDEIRN